MSDLETLLRSCGNTIVEPLSMGEARALFQDWCAAFLGNVKFQTGRYRYRGLHWHAFSFGMVSAREGSRAMEAYDALTAVPVLVIPESWEKSCGYRYCGNVLPDLKSAAQDLYIFPESFEWTMAFTHHPETHGPFFVGRSDQDTT